MPVILVDIASQNISSTYRTFLRSSLLLVLALIGKTSDQSPGLDVYDCRILHALSESKEKDLHLKSRLGALPSASCVPGSHIHLSGILRHVDASMAFMGRSVDVHCPDVYDLYAFQ